jgi:hypothetical protein
MMVFVLESEAVRMLKRLRDGQLAAGCNFEKFSEHVTADGAASGLVGF